MCLNKVHKKGWIYQNIVFLYKQQSYQHIEYKATRLSVPMSFKDGKHYFLLYYFLLHITTN